MMPLGDANPPLTPITPVFARPSPATLAPPNVKFSNDAIMRGNSEETLLSRSTEKGDDFWRRFSMVAREANAKPTQQKSWWLRETESRKTRMSIWIWLVSILLLCAIGGGVGAAWYFTRNSATHQAPKALGGSASEGFTSTSAAPASATKKAKATVTTSTKAAATAAAPAKRDTLEYVEQVIGTEQKRDARVERMTRLKKRSHYRRTPSS